jgi:hypothetical protein
VPAGAILFGARAPRTWTTIFLVTAIATSVTGYGFPASAILPSHIVGGIALLVLAATLLARYGFRLAGAWRAVYAGGMVASLYFLTFVAIAQAFAKIPVLQASAPTQAEPPFAIAQLLVLAAFVVLGLRATKAFRFPAAVAQA